MFVQYYWRCPSETSNSGDKSMVVICEAELKKRAEHNNGRLHDLEEVSLHQLNIRRIESLDKFCRDVRIVYLQVGRTTFYFGGYTTLGVC